MLHFIVELGDDGKMNKWNIPDWLEKEVKIRDKRCVYCQVKFSASKGDRRATATWEHVVNNARIITRKNIVRCCFSCNASKGSKKLSDWLESSYCKIHRIDKKTVAEVVKNAI